MLKTLRSEIDSLGWIIRTLAMAAVAGAIYKELRLPAEERTWHGRLFGFVPYDFRFPSPAKLIRSWWNPESNQLIGETPFGVGWTVNVAVLVERAQAMQAARSED